MIFRYLGKSSDFQNDLRSDGACLRIAMVEREKTQRVGDRSSDLNATDIFLFYYLFALHKTTY